MTNFIIFASTPPIFIVVLKVSLIPFVNKARKYLLVAIFEEKNEYQLFRL